MELAVRLKNQQVYVDTNIIIYLIEGLSEYEKPLGEIRELLETSQLHPITSELSLAECLVQPFKTNATEAVSLYRTFLEDSGCFDLLQIHKEVLVQAAYITAETKMKLPDAIHVATAITTNCNLFLTNDKNIRTPRNMEIVLLSDYSKTSL